MSPPPLNRFNSSKVAVLRLTPVPACGAGASTFKLKFAVWRAPGAGEGDELLTLEAGGAWTAAADDGGTAAWITLGGVGGVGSTPPGNGICRQAGFACAGAGAAARA